MLGLTKLLEWLVVTMINRKDPKLRDHARVVARPNDCHCIHDIRSFLYLAWQIAVQDFIDPKSGNLVPGPEANSSLIAV
ncbi:hypothetical protein ACH58_25940 [Achromobacter xylosoxidans]|nr:hypothetical protein ACH58_25940 [Achromobacter xylosoxidans]